MYSESRQPMTARATAQPSGGDGAMGRRPSREDVELLVSGDGIIANICRDWLDMDARLAAAERVFAAAKDVAHFWHDAPASPETCDKYIAALNTLRDTLAATHPDTGGDE